jgi:hypothetical protein
MHETPQGQTEQNCKRLIMEGNNFIVVIDREGDIDWKTDEEYGWGNLDETYQRKFNLILNRVAEQESICDLSTELGRFKRLSAEALARALDRDLLAANDMLDAVERMLREKLRDQCRTRYLVASLVFSSPFFLLALWFLNDWFADNAQIGFWVLIASSFGALGALLSVILGNNEPKCSPTATRHAQVIEAGARILGGAIAGSLMAVAVKTGWIFEPISKGSQGNATAIIAAFAAGFLERLAPSLVSQFEGGTRKSSEAGVNPPAPPSRGARRAGNIRRTSEQRGERPQAQPESGTDN